MDDNGVITVRDLRRRYGGSGGRGFDAVRGVSFSVQRGELFALLGTNGGRSVHAPVPPMTTSCKGSSPSLMISESTRRPVTGHRYSRYRAR